MIRLLTATLLFASAALAQVEIPHVHENGDVIDAHEINANLDIVANAVPPRDCSTNQIIKWNGSAWVCTSLFLQDRWEGVGDFGEEMHAYCPDGRQAVGGGCAIFGEKCLRMVSKPLNENRTLEGWLCIGQGEDCIVNEAYAICQ